MEDQLIQRRQRQMGHQHLSRTGRNEPKEIEDEVLMEETRTDSKNYQMLAERDDKLQKRI